VTKPWRRGVLCFVHDTHRAASQLFRDAVMENILANHQQHAQGNTIFRTLGWVEVKVSVFSVLRSRASWGQGRDQALTIWPKPTAVFRERSRVVAG